MHNVYIVIRITKRFFAYNWRYVDATFHEMDTYKLYNRPRNLYMYNV